MDQLTYFKVSEMNQASRPRRQRGFGAVLQNGQPYFLDANNNPITQIACGGSYNFTVPGMEGGQVWLTMFKDGQKVYDNAFSIPMGMYTSTCANDVGSYVANVYDMSNGNQLGQATLAVLPAGGGPVPTPTPTGTTPGTTPGASTLPFGLSSESLLLIAAGAFLLFKKGVFKHLL